jgi:endonuclease/exonuclease/phosphatase family metal-dependent hydrolase
MMKQNYYMARFMTVTLVAAMALGLALGCTKAVETGETDGMVLRASMADAQTKTGLGTFDDVNKEYSVVWKTGDKISVNGTLSNAVSEGDNGKGLVDFTVSGSLSAPYKVLYPGTTSPSVISLPATQSYVANSFNGAAAACWGNAVKNGNKYSVSLHHICGVIRFALKGGATLDKIVLNSLGSEKLSGDFTLATDGNGFTGAFTGGTSGTLTYSFGSGVTLKNADQYFYVLIPAQAYAAGIEALVYQADGAFMRLKFWGSGYTLDSENIIAMESKTYAAGRTENLLAINALTAENGGEPTAEAPGITVASYNVMRLDDSNRPAAATTGDSNGKIARPANAIVKDCAEMQDALGLAIYNTAADLIGFNEIGDNMYASGQTYSLEDIAAAQGASYTWKLNFPGSESGNYHYCNGFAYKSSVLTCNESGKAWLRTNSESYSTSSASNSGDPNRFVVWAKFTHKVSGKVFYFFVTQLPTASQGGNTNMSGGVNAFATAKAGSYPQILVGDMNSAPGHSSEAGYNKLKTYWTDAYEAVSAAGNLAPFYSTYSGTQSGTGATWQYSILQYTKNHPERRIDHIMTHGACTAQTYRTVRNIYEFGSGEDAVTCSPSDHLPVVSYITLD